MQGSPIKTSFVIEPTVSYGALHRPAGGGLREVGEATGEQRGLGKGVAVSCGTNSASNFNPCDAESTFLSLRHNIAKIFDNYLTLSCWYSLESPC